MAKVKFKGIKDFVGHEVEIITKEPLTYTKEQYYEDDTLVKGVYEEVSDENNSFFGVLESVTESELMLSVSSRGNTFYHSIPRDEYLRCVLKERSEEAKKKDKELAEARAKTMKKNLKKAKKKKKK